MHNNTCFGTYLYYIGTHHGNLHKSIVTMSRMTYVLFAGRNGETALANSNAIKKKGEDLEKMKVKGPGRYKLGQGRNS